MSEIGLQPMNAGGPMTEADWTARNPLLDRFQIGLVVDAATGMITKAKLGDGTHRWNDLEWWSPDGGLIQSAVLLADFPKTNNTLTAVPDLTLNLEAGHWYRVTGSLLATGGAGEIKFDLAGGTATATGCAIGWDVIVDGRAGSLVTSALDSTFSAANVEFTCPYNVTATIEVATSGTLILRFAQNITDVAASTLLKYTTIQAIDITPQ